MRGIGYQQQYTKRAFGRSRKSTIGNGCGRSTLVGSAARMVKGTATVKEMGCALGSIGHRIVLSAAYTQMTNRPLVCGVSC